MNFLFAPLPKLFYQTVKNTKLLHALGGLCLLRWTRLADMNTKQCTKLLVWWCTRQLDRQEGVQGECI
jgi:hypothetical protein